MNAIKNMKFWQKSGHIILINLLRKNNWMVTKKSLKEKENYDVVIWTNLSTKKGLPASKYNLLNELNIELWDRLEILDYSCYR